MSSGETVADLSAPTADPGERDRAKHTRVDRVVVHFSNIAAWILPILMMAIVIQVIIRKMGYNQAWLDDAQWWMYGFASVCGLAYAITTEGHVRVDIFYQNFSKRRKALTELFGVGWLLLPFLLLMVVVFKDYAIASWLAGEGSDSPNGLHRLYLLKISIPIIFVIAMLGALAVCYRHLKTIAEPTLWRMILAAFPFAWFAGERIVYYSMWWAIKLSDPEINERRIPRSDVFDPFEVAGFEIETTTFYGLIVVLVLFGVSFLLSRREGEAAQ